MLNCTENADEQTCQSYDDILLLSLSEMIVSNSSHNVRSSLLDFGSHGRKFLRVLDTEITFKRNLLRFVV